MMSDRGLVVLSLDVAGGNQLSSPQDFVFAEDQLVQLLGGLVEGHGSSPHSPPPPMVTASSLVYINDIPVCREGDVAACGHASSGRPWVFLD